MEGILELLPSVLGGHSVPQLQNYLDACEEHVAFHGRDKKNEAYIKLVNTRLNENDNKLEGLLILKVALQQCSADAFVDNAKSWMSHCLKGSFDKNPTIAKVSLAVLGNLLKNAVTFPEIKKHASVNIVPNTLEHARREINVQTIQSFLECLIVCLKDYSGPCGEANKFILDLLTRLLDTDAHLLSSAAKCYALLSQAKGMGVPHKDAWKMNQLVLVHSLHYYLDLLFSNVDEIQTAHRPPKGNIKPLISKKINSKASATERMQYIMKNIKGLSKYLQAMLLGSFPGIKVVMPDAIIGIVCRGLAVTCHSLGTITNDALSLSAVLPEVHADLLNILIALITCCGRNLIQYGSVICKLVNQELKWTSTSDWPYGLDKPFRNLRSAVYTCLHCWLSMAKSASSIEVVVEELIQNILQDIRMDKPVITLKAKSGKSNISKPQYNFSSESRSDKLSTKLANQGLCYHSLKCLQLVLYSSTTFMKTSLCKIVQESVVSLLFEVQNTHDGPPIPYSNGACRKELYSTLLALCMEPHPAFPPPLNYALAIFKAGLTDPLSEISLICVTALSNLEKIIHPSAPPLGSTLQYDTIQQYSENNISKTGSISPSNGINSTPPSIKDMPLSAFPNLNNVIVVKVYDNKDNGKENDKSFDTDGSNSDTQSLGTGTSTTVRNSKNQRIFQKTTFNLNGANAISHNCNLSDIISMDNSFNGDISLKESDLDGNHQNENNSSNDNKNYLTGSFSYTDVDVVQAEKPTEKISLFEKINGICGDIREEIVPINSISSRDGNGVQNVLEKQAQKMNGVCGDVIKEVVSVSSLNEKGAPEVTPEPLSALSETNNENVFIDGPPIKKMKVSETLVSNDDETKMNLEKDEVPLTNSESTKVNGETDPVHDEDEMMSSFIDVVQE